jgi:peptide/nickel transport system substrate-binding protein
MPTSVGRRRTVVLAALAILLLGACAGPGPHHTIRVVATFDAGQLDPLEIIAPQQDLLLRNVFQTLLSVGPDGGEPQNDLAESCRYSAPTAYTCRIKDGAGFPDGTPVRPRDIAWTFVGHYRDVSSPSPTASRIRSLIREVQTVDDHTVTFELTRADASLPYLLTEPAASVLRDGYDPGATGVAGAFGSGAYRVESGSVDTGDFVLVANPHYSAAGTVGNDRVVIRRVADVAEGVAAVAEGSADVFYPSRAEVPAVVADPKGSDLAKGASSSTTVLALDRALPGDSDRPARQALAALIDHRALANAAGGVVTPLWSLLPDQTQWSIGPSLHEPGPDLARAAELVKGSGRTTPIPLRFAAPAEQAQPLTDELVRQLQAGGLFDVTVVGSNATRGAARLVARSPSAPDPLAYLTLANGVTRSAEVAGLIDRARSETDIAAREQLVVESQHQLADESVAIPLWQDNSAALARPGTERVTFYPFPRLWLLRPAP